MSSNNQKKSAIVVGDDDADATAGFTQRVLMSLVVDVTCLAENVERIRVQVTAMARENGVPIPKP